MPYQNHNQWDSLPINLTGSEIENPLSVIHQYFTEESGLPETIKSLNQVYHSAFSDTCHLNKHEVVLLFGFRECLDRLIESCSLLLSHDLNNCILTNENDLLNPKYFCKDLTPNYKPWHYIPRHLNDEEYINPRQFLIQFFRIQSLAQWKDTLKDLFTAAMEDNSVFSGAEDQDFYMSCEYLLKLVEAAHLIYVRH